MKFSISPFTKKQDLTVYLLGFALFGNALAQRISEIVSTSNFISDIGGFGFLGVLMVGSAISLVATGCQYSVVDRFDRRRSLSFVCLCLSLILLLINFSFILGAPHWLGHSGLYLISEQQYMFYPALFWALANCLFDSDRAKEVFPILVSFGFAGDISGIAISALMPQLETRFSFGLEGVLAISIALYFVIYLLLEWPLKAATKGTATQSNPLKRPKPTRQTPVANAKDTKDSRPTLVKEFPLFLRLVLYTVATFTCAIIIEYRFLVTTETAFDSPDRLQTFLSLFALARLLAYVLIQMFLTRRILDKLGIARSLLLVPASGVFSALCMMVAPGLGGTSTGLTLQKIPQYSIDETARRVLQGFAPKHLQGRVSLFLESYAVAGGTFLGALVTAGIVVSCNRLQIPNEHLCYLAAAAVAGLCSAGAIQKIGANERTMSAPKLS